MVSSSNFLDLDLDKQKKIKLGLDLQGGSYLLLELDNEPVIKQKLQSKLLEIKDYFKKNKIKILSLKLDDKLIKLKVSKDDVEKISEIFSDKESTINPYYFQYKAHQLDVKINGDVFNLELSKYGIILIKNASLDQAIEIVRKRVDEVGTNEPNILKRGNDRILLELPGLDNPDRIKSLLGKTADLAFRLESKSSNESFGTEKLKLIETGEELLLSKRVIISGDNLVDVSPRMDSLNNQTVVSFTLDRVGSKRFAQATKRNIGTRLAIVLDGQIISAPVIRDVIAGGSGQISGGFTFQSATDLALLLRSGALPAPLNIIEERTVGPDLGQDSINAGILSL
ncbi:protein translocase subunit SecD, partial [Candidatus Pelagibacter sp.]|nr:protein translocase subunit SecD [Candidatus Pelagibacter sp.]